MLKSSLLFSVYVSAVLFVSFASASFAKERRLLELELESGDHGEELSVGFDGTAIDISAMSLDEFHDLVASDSEYMEDVISLAETNEISYEDAITELYELSIELSRSAGNLNDGDLVLSTDDEVSGRLSKCRIPGVDCDFRFSFDVEIISLIVTARLDISNLRNIRGRGSLRVTALGLELYRTSLNLSTRQIRFGGENFTLKLEGAYRIIIGSNGRDVFLEVELAVRPGPRFLVSTYRFKRRAKMPFQLPA